MIHIPEDPERIKARLGKCYIPDCDEDPKWFSTSWVRMCDEHKPEETRNWASRSDGPITFHSFT